MSENFNNRDTYYLYEVIDPGVTKDGNINDLSSLKNNVLTKKISPFLPKIYNPNLIMRRYNVQTIL